MLIRHVLPPAASERRAGFELPVDMQLVDIAVAEAHRRAARDRLLRAARWTVTVTALIAVGWLGGLAMAHGKLLGADVAVVAVGLAAAVVAWTPPLRAAAGKR